MMEPLFSAPTRPHRPSPRGRTKSRKPACAASTPKEFEFISSDPVGRPDPGSRKLIRSYVMRGKNTKPHTSTTQRRRTARRKELPTELQADEPLPEVVTVAETETQDGQESRDNTQSTSSDTFVQFECHPGLMRVPCDLKLFQFSSPLDDKSRYLIFRFLTTVKETMYPVEWCFATDPTKVCWFRWLAEDAGYLHAVFFMVSAFQDLLDMQAHASRPGGPWSQSFSPRTRWYLRKTIRILQDNLGDRERQLRDTTMSAVISLAMVADAAGDTEAFEAHVKGLKQMVKMRGGLRGFHHNRQLQVKLCRVDLGWSIKYGSKPDIYGGKLSWDPFLETALQNHSITLLWSSNPSIEAVAESWDYKLANVFKDTRDFANVANRLISGHAKLPPELFQEIMLSIQYRALLLDYSVTDQPLQEAARLGLLAFESTIFLQIPGVKIRSEVFASQLREAVESVPVDDAAVADVKLWILLVGSISIFEGGEPWLVACVRDLCGDQAWAEVRSRMKDVMWIDVIHDEAGRIAFEKTQHGHVLQS